MTLPPRADDAAPGMTGGWDGGCFAIAAFTAPLLSVFAPLGMAPLFVILALLLLIADAIRGRGLPRGLIAAWRSSRGLQRFTLLGVLLCAWALASAAWAAESAQALSSTGQLFGALCAAVICIATAGRLNGPARRNVGRALVAGIAAALALLIAERLDDAWLGRQLHTLGAAGPDQIFSKYNRGLTVMLLLMAPALLALRSNLARLALGIVAVAVVMTYFGSSLQLAAGVAMLALALALCLPRAMPWIAGLTIALFVVAAPALPPLTIKTVDTDAITARTQNISIAHRIIIWQFTAERIADKPLAGWGIGAARAIPGGNDKVVLIPSVRPIMGERLPLHTHNAALQWWLELGVIGATLMAGLWLFALTMIARHAPARAPRAIALGGFAAAFVIASLSYGAWQAWWLSTLGLVATLLTLHFARPASSAT